MALSFQDRWVGDVAVVSCSGRIVEGPEVALLERHVHDLSSETHHIVLHLGGVDFIDSSGIGLLVRLLARLRNAGGGLGLCAVTPKIREVLTVTRLHRMLEPHEAEADGIAAAFRVPADRPEASDARAILCVAQSPDALAYVRELLRSAGYVVVSAANLPDALTLLIATQPRAIVIGTELRSMRNTRAAAAFNERAESLPIVELPVDFSTDDAGHAGRQVLARLQAALGAVGTAPS